MVIAPAWPTPSPLLKRRERVASPVCLTRREREIFALLQQRLTDPAPFPEEELAPAATPASA